MPILGRGLSGGAGFTFEDASVALYLAALLGEESGPGLSNRVITRVAVQQAAFGEPLDDLIVDAKANDQTFCRLSLQVKRALTISLAPSNADFREIVTRAWRTLEKNNFREDCDRVGCAAGTVAEGSRRALEEVCEWARSSATLETFVRRFEVPGFAGDERKHVLSVFCQILTGVPGIADADAAAYRLLRHFILIKFNVLTQGSTDDAHASLDVLLAEIGVTGTSILFIDGLDRVAVPQRPIITDLISTLLNSPSTAGWRIVATLRDNGIEPLRTWLPPALFAGGGVATVEVKPFDDSEAALLAKAKPVLQGLLFGEARVRDIARRAFFADILARALQQSTETNPPHSETDLIEAWWSRGGYNSDGSLASIRQRALIKLAELAARTPHRRISVVQSGWQCCMATHQGCAQ
jgi:hypothetical protein